MYSKELHFWKGLVIPQIKTMLRPHCNVSNLDANILGPIQMRAAIMRPSFHQKGGVIERGLVQAGSSHLKGKFSFE